MIYNYVVTLKNQQTRYLDIIGFLLSFISIICFIEEMVKSQEVGIAYLFGSIFIIGVLAWNVYQSRKNHRKVYYSRALLIAALVWMKMPYFQWLSFAFIILALLEYQAKYAVEIGFSEKEIVMNTLFKKKYNWMHFTNIILKDGLLTMDFASNRILQREVEDDEDDDAEEEEFNDFCRECISRNSK
jgi:drug/metabolite transporter superfamily protein YnfA